MTGLAGWGRGQLARVRAEHSAWAIERTPGYRVIGYTATLDAGGTADTVVVSVRALNLTRLAETLRKLGSLTVSPAEHDRGAG